MNEKKRHSDKLNLTNHNLSEIFTAKFWIQDLYFMHATTKTYVQKRKMAVR